MRLSSREYQLAHPIRVKRPLNRHDDLALICRVPAHACALPLTHVEETMRVLPVEPLAGLPHFVRGLTVIRGAAVPVVDAASLLGAQDSRPTRLVTVKAADRRVALAFDAVLGVREVPVGSLQELPPLLRDASAEVISAIGILDTALLLVLRSSHLVPENVWAALNMDAVSR
jgi:purine-binding chemotaxis protein CheW